MTDTSTTTQTPLERDLAALTAPTAPTAPTALDAARPLWEQALAQHDAAPTPARRSIFHRPINQRYAAAAALLLVASAAIIAVILPALGSARFSRAALNTEARNVAAEAPAASPPIMGSAEFERRDFAQRLPRSMTTPNDRSDGSLGPAITSNAVISADPQRAAIRSDPANLAIPEYFANAARAAREGLAKDRAAPTPAPPPPLAAEQAAPGLASSQPAPAPAAATPAFDPSLFYDRLVIRKANIELKTASPAQAALKAAALVSPADGEFIQSSNTRGDTAATVTLRVRSARVDEILAQLRALGTVTTETQSGDDVTDQMIDLEARLRNERRIETELVALVDARRGAPLNELLNLRENLDRARERIERLVAQRDRVGRQVALATIQAGFVLPETPTPPTPKPAEETFLDRLGRATSRGLDDLGRSITKLIEIILGGLLVWIGLGLLVLLFIALFRRAFRPASFEPPPRP